MFPAEHLRQHTSEVFAIPFDSAQGAIVAVISSVVEKDLDLKNRLRHISPPPAKNLYTKPIHKFYYQCTAFFSKVHSVIIIIINNKQIAHWLKPPLQAAININIV